MTEITPVSYTPHVWLNSGASGAFPLNATRANEIEAGIKDCADAINDLIPATSGFAEESALLDVGLWPGRKIDDIPEIQGELDTYGSVPAFLSARAQAKNSKFLRVGDYTVIQHTGSIGNRINRIWDFWPYLNAGSTPKGGHIVMGPDEVWPTTIVWNTTNNNNGTAAQQFPYPASNLHQQELSQILPTFPTAWQNVMLENEILAEKRYSASGALNSATGWDWVNVGKIWSPSETEVYGQIVWATNNGYSVGYDCQFAYFRSTRNRIKTLNGERAGWWLRSVNGSSSTNACNVNNYGNADSTSCSHTGVRALPCFLIGA